jgi:hypothetical protein
MKSKASPRQVMNIIYLTEKKIWKNYRSYDKVLAYINRWQEQIWDVNNTGWNGYDGFNFEIIYKDQKNKEINLIQTLNNMDDDTLFRVAVDMGVQIPNIIYAVPKIIDIAADNYKDIHTVLENAFKKVSEDPSHSIALANSALETIIKRILEDINPNYNRKDTLYKLAQTILKEFKITHNEKEITDIRNIGSGLLTTAQSIENLRSNHTKEAHGKLEDDYIIDDPLYAYFIINAVSSVGLFLLNFYEQKYSKKEEIPSECDDVPF